MANTKDNRIEINNIKQLFKYIEKLYMLRLLLNANDQDPSSNPLTCDLLQRIENAKMLCNFFVTNNKIVTNKDLIRIYKLYININENFQFSITYRIVFFAREYETFISAMSPKYQNTPIESLPDKLGVAKALTYNGDIFLSATKSSFKNQYQFNLFTRLWLYVGHFQNLVENYYRDYMKKRCVQIKNKLLSLST